MGGGVMRTAAAKAAVLGGYRSVTAAAVRPAATSISCSLNVGEVVPSASASASAGVLVSSVGGPTAAVVQRSASCDVDGWEFAGGAEEELFDSMQHPVPRLVFGPPPTIEEAREATSDLKEALEIAYFSSPTAGKSRSNFQATEPMGQDCESNIGIANSEASIIRAMPTHVVQAFSLLQESPGAQEVVASLAADKNVWDAVMKNEKVMEFYRNHQLVLPPSESVIDEISKHDNQDTGASFEDLDASASKNSMFSQLSEYVGDIKMKVSRMVDSLSEFFHDLFGVSSAAQTSTSSETSSTANVNTVVASSFIGLAIAAIIVVLLKRE